MNQPRMTLKIDGQAMAALFPENTEARIELQQAVLQEVAKKFIKGELSDDIQAYLKTLAEDVKKEVNINQVVADYFTSSPGWNSVTKLRPDTKLTTALALAVQNAFGDSFVTLMQTEIDKRVKEHTDKLEERVEYEVNNRLNRLTNEAIQKRVDAGVAAMRSAL